MPVASLSEAPLPIQLQQLDHDRLSRYRDNLAFYEGRQWPGRARRGERRLTFNYAKAFVDKATSFLLTGATLQLEGGESAEGRSRAAAAERALREVESANALAQLDYETELDCAVLGDACYKVTWDETDRGVRVTAPDVQGIFAWRQPDDPSRLSAIAAQYRLSSAPDTARSDDDLVTEHWTAEAFELWHGNEVVSRGPNPYGFIPFILLPNVCEPKQHWGASDIPALVESNR